MIIERQAPHSAQAFRHDTYKSLMWSLLSSHSSLPYKLMQYEWNSQCLINQLNLLKKHRTLLDFATKLPLLLRISALSALSVSR